jgi:hypothetical protein
MTTWNFVVIWNKAPGKLRNYGVSNRSSTFRNSVPLSDYIVVMEFEMIQIKEGVTKTEEGTK